MSGTPKPQYIEVYRITQLWMAARFALSVLKANPMEMSERMAIKKLEKALAEIEKLYPSLKELNELREKIK